MHTIVIAAFDGAIASGLVGIVDLLSLSQFGLIKGSDRYLQIKSWTPEVIIASHDGSPIKDGRGKIFPVDLKVLLEKHPKLLLLGYILKVSVFCFSLATVRLTTLPRHLAMKTKPLFADYSSSKWG